MKILNIPIEPLADRYSCDWDRWFHEAFGETYPVLTIYGTNVTSGKINTGSFLDVVETNMYKNSQLFWILDYLKTYDDKETLVLFFHDLWNPALTSIAYVRDGLGLKNLRICGCLHAGSYDEFDFLNKKGMTDWAKHFEYMLIKVVDKIFVATEYHKQLLQDTRTTTNLHKIVVTGFPIYDEYVSHNPLPTDDLEPIVVFPHRLDSEKNPQLFDDLAKRLSDYTCVKSKEKCTTKEQYYRLLKTADIAVSFADQETWGIAMQEALICGCFVVCPNRLSYKEMYNEIFLYNTFEQCLAIVEDISENFLKYDNARNEDRLKILESGRNAIPNMIKEMEKL